MEAILAFGPTILDRTIVPIVRHITYPFKCDSNVAKLKDKLEALELTRECTMHQVDEETRNGRVIENEVDKWIADVQVRVERLREQLDDEERIQKKCFVGLCPNVKARYQLSKQAEKEAVDLNVLRSTRDGFKSLTYQPDLPRIQARNVKDYEAFDSRSHIFKEIMDALLFSNSEMIGVYGTGGVGKTMLVQEVARQAENSFDVVVMASVEQIPEITDIQAKIMGQLRMKFTVESREARADRLHKMLMGKKKILIILDNLWEKLDLAEIGIPSKNENCCCKILLTSRKLNVLSNEMNCQNNIRVHDLSREEAWCLFEKKAGICSLDRELLSTARDICDRCGGLPLAISTLATALKDKSLSDWKDALLGLKRPSKRNFTGVSSKVYSALQLSYNYLADEELKSTFLLCCQMNYCRVEYLLKFGMSLSLFGEVCTIEEAQHRVQSSVCHLEASCLLEKKDGFIVIHDLVRDVGLSIASRDENVFFRESEFDMKRWPKNLDDLRSFKAISLQRCTQLPEELDCPKLCFFRLVSEDGHLKIPDNIFKKMKELKVLVMTGHSLPFLPSSLANLQNLQTLCLDYSELEDISMIGELKKLEFLSLCGARLERLPTEIGKLSQLRSLDLTDCYFLKVIPPNVLSKLSSLEELCIDNGFDQWEIFEGQKNASLDELQHLKLLTNLAIHIRDPQILPEKLFSDKLKRYKIYIGDDWEWDAVKASKTLKLKLDTDIRHECYGVRILMKTVEELYLDEVKGVGHDLYQLNSEGFPHLKHLHIKNNSEIKHLVDGPSNGLPSNHAFVKLESLVLNHLVSLKKIYHGRLNTQSFGSLRTLEVNRCRELKYLLTSSVAKCMSQLEKMAVRDCVKLEMIVAEESEAIDKIEFGRLQYLTLSRLPQLKCFLSKVEDPLATEQIAEDEELMTSPHWSLFNAKVIFPSLEYLRLSSIQVENIWHDHQPVDLSFWTRKLTTMVVEGCENLSYLFSPSMVTSLVQLQRLEISDCKCIKGIVFTGREIETTRPFPNLHSLELNDLPKLVTFCIGNLIELSSLKDLRIQKCPGMKAFITSSLDSDGANSTFFDNKVSVPDLEKLQISNMGHLKMIWHTQFHPNSFCKLKILRIEYVGELLSIFPSNSFLTQFCYLEELYICLCDSLEMFFDKQMLIYPQESNSTSPSPLRRISIRGLRNLKYVWNWDEINDLQGIVSFHNLREVNVEGCPTLEALFPASVARNLPYLEKLSVEYCKGLTEIVAKEDGGPLFEFRQLTSLLLNDLPKLSAFYPGMHISKWPELKKLHLKLLPQMNIFDVESRSIAQPADDDGLKSRQISVSQPFLPFAEILPNLEELWLSSSDVRKHPAGLFYQLKRLVLSFAGDESTVFPFDLHKFPRLETLEVFSGNFKNLFPREEEDGGTNSLGRKIIQQLRHLTLKWIDSLNRIWNPDSDRHQNIETLRGNIFPNLIELAPSTASFQSLTKLDVYDCEGLRYILSPTTANSLVQLTDMRISECDMVAEIVANEGDELDDSIIFMKLTSLRLLSLPSLSCFCSAKLSLKFPQLTELVVEECPKMMVFSKGAVNTSKLKVVQFRGLDESLCRWNGNLNSTVEMLFKEMVEFQRTRHLALSEFPWLRDTWNDELPGKRFSDLESPVAEGGSFYKAISSNLLCFLNWLKVQLVRNCDSYGEGLDLHGLDAEQGEVEIMPGWNDST